MITSNKEGIYYSHLNSSVAICCNGVVMTYNALPQKLPRTTDLSQSQNIHPACAVRNICWVLLDRF